METRSASRFLDLGALAALEHLRFTTRHRIEGAYSGRHPSRVQGGAGEFVDYREYSTGEDLRRLDWKVLARSGRAYVRLYQDETNLLCTLAIDTSGSMQFGPRAGSLAGRVNWFAGDASGAGASDRHPRTKLEYVQFLCSALAHVIARGQDQVGVALLGSHLRKWVPPGGTTTHLAQLYRAIDEIVPEPGTRMQAALSELFNQISRRGVLLLLSDFLMDDLEEVFAALRLFRHRRFEVLILHVVHPDEEQLPMGTAFRFEGMENEGHVDCSPADIRSQYQERFTAHAAMVRSLALAGGCDYRRISTAIDYLQTLRGFLVERSA